MWNDQNEWGCDDKECGLMVGGVFFLWHTLCCCVQVFFGGGGGGSVSSSFVSPPSMSLLTSMVFSSCVVGAGSVIACILAGSVVNACGTVCAIMKGAGNIHPLCIPLILRPGTGPSACHVHTVTSA